jgi:hypothetical protein
MGSKRNDEWIRAGVTAVNSDRDWVTVVLATRSMVLAVLEDLSGYVRLPREVFRRRFIEDPS